MADIATLVVKMTAESAQMRAEIERLKKQVSSADASIASIGKGLKVVGGLAAGAFSIGAITAFASRCIQTADALQDMSDKLGVSAANLQSIQLAAQASGGSVEGVNAALDKMAVSLGNAANGQKSAVSAFQNLNLNFRELSQLAPDEAFRRIADRLAAVENPYQRAALSQEIFSKSAKDIRGLLSEGSAAIDVINSRLESMGARLTDVDISKIAQLKDEFGFTSTAFQNLVTKILANASPSFGVIVQSFNNVITAMGGASESGRGFGIILTAIAKLVESFALQIVAAFQAVNGVLELTKAGFLTIAGLFDSTYMASAKAAEAAGLASFENANKTQKAAFQAALDVVNAAEIFDAEAARLEQRAAAAAAAVQNGVGAISGKRELTAAERRMQGVDARADTLDLTSLMTDNQLKEAIEREHLDRMALMNYQYHQDKFLAMSEFQRLQFDIQQAFGLQTLEFEEIKSMSVLDIAGQMFTALGGAGSKFFKVQQGFAIANAIINTAQGITEALKLPFPASLAAAAKVAAMGAIQIAKIKATNTSGSGGAPSAGGGGSASAGVEAARAATQGNADQSQESQKKVAQVIVNGNLFSGRETADWLIGQISEAVNDRDVVFMNGNSRQASVLGGG